MNDMYDNDVCAYFDCMYSDGCNVSECAECTRNGRRSCSDCVYFGLPDCPDNCIPFEEEASDSFPAFYQGGDLDDYERSISMIRTEDGCREDEEEV